MEKNTTEMLKKKTFSRIVQRKQKFHPPKQRSKEGYVLGRDNSRGGGEWVIFPPEAIKKIYMNVNYTSSANINKK